MPPRSLGAVSTGEFLIMRLSFFPFCYFCSVPYLFRGRASSLGRLAGSACYCSLALCGSPRLLLVARLTIKTTLYLSMTLSSPPPPSTTPLEPMTIAAGTYLIRNVASNLYLDLRGSSAAPGTDIIIWTRTGNNNQQACLLPTDV